ncbi:MAG: alpha/beta hydrolase [Candidatus Eremiobacteraeota bacterium]|nr:alpha/beta hydrolase [Candidatus Eremiobacteraeota bacterium]
MTSADPFHASATVDDVTVFFRRWRAWSDDVRAHTLHARDLQYGPSADETLDLVVPHTGAPLVVWFHGGYWRRLHKDDNTFVARGLAPHGVAVAIVNYGLAPAVPLEEIVAQAQRSVAWLSTNAKAHGADPSRIVVAGHSAGGHLAAMCAVDAPVAGVVSLSGLHDLRAVAKSHVNEWLQLDDARAAALSPTLLIPAAPSPVIAITGARETDAFKEQGREFADAWRAYGCDATYAESDDDHFTLSEHLVDPSYPLTKRIADLALANGKRHAKV